MTPRVPKSLIATLHVLLLGAAAVLFALHFRHLAADFPNHSQWMDWSKYTDEGWYGDAAIRHFQLGHWYLAGDFNPAVALPVWPAIEALVFHFTGVSLVAARALTVVVFGCILLASWGLLARGRKGQSLAASVAVLLLAASPFCFVFTRLAILEPLLVLLTLLALIVARTVRPELASPWREAVRANLLPIVGLGLLLPAMILTKTTALFLVPAIGWMLFATVGYRVRALLRVAIPAGAIAGSLWLGYFLLLVRPHFLLDYRYLFSANGYTGITLDTAGQVLGDTLKDGMWMGGVIYPCALLAVLAALVRFRLLRAHPLLVALVLWAGGYMAFLAYHDNLQPRYYLVIAVPLTLLVPLVCERLVLEQLTRPALYRGMLALFAIATLAIVIPDVREMAGFLRNPEYTLLHAAEQVHDYIAADERADPAHNPLVLSISGSEMSLMTGIHSIDDDFGTLELGDRVKKYRPGWYVAWNQLDDDKMDAMTPLYHIERVASWPAMDDPDRNLLILYRLDPADGSKPRPRKGAPVPKALRTKVGQQPSTTQLEH